MPYSTDKVRAWRESGLTLAEIQAKCIECTITTRLGTTPSISTLHLWCVGIEPPRAKPVTQEGPVPARRIEKRVENAGLGELIMTMRAAGRSLNAITRSVEAHGYRTSRGNPILKSQVIRVIQRAESA